MECMDPVLCYRNNKGAQYRHFSLATRLFKSIAQTRFSCGTCIHCRKRRSKELAIRCVLHASLYQQNCFLTLTYDEKKPDYHNELQYKDIQDFKKRLRDHCNYHFGKRVQIFNVHEYGENGKKHWHLVLFNHNFSDKTRFRKSGNNILYTSKTLDATWSHGHCTIGDVSEASAMYQAQYTQKDLKNGNSNNAKKAKSNHSGIGRDYFLIHYDQILRLGYIPFAGKKIPIPRYFQRLAHKHYSFFNDASAFIDLPHRKKLYGPFDLRTSWPEKNIADLFTQFSEQKQRDILEAQAEWDIIIEEHLATNKTPDFVVSGQNSHYDLTNKVTSSNF